MIKRSVLSVFLVVAMAGTITQAQERQATISESTVEAIRMLEKEWIAAFNRGNTDTMAKLVTDDLITMPPNSPALIGKEASLLWWKNVFTGITYKNIALTEEIVVAGDWAYVRNSVYWSVVGATGKEAARGQAKSIHIMKMQADGSWRLALDIWNSDN